MIEILFQIQQGTINHDGFQGLKRGPEFGGQKAPENRHNPKRGHCRIQLYIACTSYDENKCSEKLDFPNENASLMLAGLNEFILCFCLCFFSIFPRNQPILRTESFRRAIKTHSRRSIHPMPFECVLVTGPGPMVMR